MKEAIQNPPAPSFIRMKYGKEGPDYTRDMWEANLVGIMFGPWRSSDVMTGGMIDAEKLTPAYLNHLPDMPRLSANQWGAVRRFMLDLEPGETIMSVAAEVVYVGEVGAGFVDVPMPQHGECFTCRPVVNRRAFRLADLPAVYRLLPNTQGTLCRINALRPQAELLARSQSAADVGKVMLQMPTHQFLQMLSPAQWEVICSEYLRDRIGFRFLLLAPGGTLAKLDLVGVDCHGHRVLVHASVLSQPGLLHPHLHRHPRQAL